MNIKGTIVVVPKKLRKLPRGAIWICGLLRYIIPFVNTPIALMSYDSSTLAKRAQSTLFHCRIIGKNLKSAYYVRYSWQ